MNPPTQHPDLVAAPAHGAPVALRVLNQGLRTAGVRWRARGMLGGVLLAALGLIGGPSAARACTTFLLSDPANVVFGWNYDFFSAEGRVVVNRRGLGKTAFGTDADLQWISRYGSVTFNQFGHEFPLGGINEAGLVVGQMMLDETWYPVDARPALRELQWIQYQLDCAASVEEVLASVPALSIQPISFPMHFLVADASGHVVVIEYLDGKLVVRKGADLPVAALTNDTYDGSLGFAGTTSPGRVDSVSSLGRFVHAAAAVADYGRAPAADPVACAFGVLAQVTQPVWTRWSTVYDLDRRTVYFRTQTDPTVRWIRLDALDFRPTAPIRMMDINASAAGEVVPSEPYSAADNLALMLTVYNASAPGIGPIPAEYIRAMAAYPDSVVPLSRPSFAARPGCRSAVSGTPVSLAGATTDTGGGRCQWYRGGKPVAGATAATLRFDSVVSTDAGIYDLISGGGSTAALSAPVVLGVLPPLGQRIAGGVATRAEWQDIHHPNGAVYDQFLLTGAAGTFTADPGQIARMSYLDDNRSIVQVEMSGAGAVTVVLAGATGPLAPALYNQNGIEYMKGKATIILAGADATTHFTIYSVGTATNPGVTRADVAYSGWADVAVAGIVSTDGGLGGIHQGNAAYNSKTGFTGIYAPTVTSVGGIAVVHGVAASDGAIPYLYFGPGGAVKVTIAGSALAQLSGDGLTVGGLAQVHMGAGQDSCGRAAPAEPIATRLYDSVGTDVTGVLVGGP